MAEAADSQPNNIAQAKSGSYNVSRSSDGDDVYSDEYEENEETEDAGQSPKKVTKYMADEPQKSLKTDSKEQKTDTSIEATKSSDKWVCVTCGFDNMPLDLKCALCQAPKPAIQPTSSHEELKGVDASQTLKTEEDPLRQTRQQFKSSQLCEEISADVGLACGVGKCNAGCCVMSSITWNRKVA